MHDDAYAELMNIYDKWDNRARRQRFVARMEHKLNAKERRSNYHRP
jgi:hypothetical protein